MSGPEQLFFLVVVPVVIVAVIWSLASIGGPQARKRYRPGRQYDFTPVWYLANHQPDARPERAQLTAGSSDPAGSAGTGAAAGTTGGASDGW